MSLFFLQQISCFIFIFTIGWLNLIKIWEKESRIEKQTEKIIEILTMSEVMDEPVLQLILLIIYEIVIPIWMKLKIPI